MFKIILLTIIFSLQVQANYAEKALVDSCILKSANKMVVPDEAGFPVFKTCIPEKACYPIPSDFSCIYYKASDGILELDPVKKANYENMLKDAQLIKDSYQESQTYNDIVEWCQYQLGLPCSSKKPQTRKMIEVNQLKINDKIKKKLGI